MLATVSSLWREYAGDGKQWLAGALLTLLITILTSKFFRRPPKNTAESLQLPPGPRGLPLFGYLPFLGTDLHREFSKLAKIYGPIFKLYLGNRQCVVISSPSLVKQMVRDQDTVFANHDVSIAGFIASHGGNDILFTPYGEEWKKLRKIFVREMLSNTNLDDLYALRRKEVNKSIKKIYESIGQPVDISSLGFFTVSNAIMSMLCGGETSSVIDGSEFRKKATELMVLLGKPNVSDIFPGLAWLDLQGIERETKKVTRFFETMLDSAIEPRKRNTLTAKEGRETKEQVKSKDFLQFLLELHQQGDSAESITKDQLKAMLTDIVVGGTDTTATALEWAMAELLKHPEAKNKVLEELTQVVGLNNMVEESHSSQLPYLNAVIKETLRLHPPVPFLVPRYPSKSTTLGGYYIPKGAKIFVSLWTLHNDPTYWEAPLEFSPERFLNNDDSELDFYGNNLNFIPLGSGRRVCAGMRLAERMLSYVLASFLHSFEWKLPHDGQLELSERFGLVLKKKEPLVIIPTPRLSNLELHLNSCPY